LTDPTSNLALGEPGPNRWRQIMPLLYDPFLWTGERLGMNRRRRGLLARAFGRTLKIGAGTGLKAPRSAGSAAM
jgi:hypothetical protein